MVKGLILINAYSRLESSIKCAERIKFELNALGVEADVKRNDFFCAAVNGDGSSALSNKKEYDFCVYLDKDKYASRMLEKTGMRLFNTHTAIEACDDKALTAILLADNGIPMPKTLPGLLCYDPQEPVKPETLKAVERELGGYPIIVKQSCGSLGKGVFKADDRKALIRFAEELKCTPHLFQRFIAESCGRDMRVIVIGGRVAAAMERRSDKDFRSNIELGGVGTPITPPSKVADMCVRSANILGLDYCGIDILFGKNDNYYVCEVNSNAFFGGIERVTGVNVAGLYAEHIVNVMQNSELGVYF